MLVGVGYDMGNGSIPSEGMGLEGGGKWNLFDGTKGGLISWLFVYKRLSFSTSCFFRFAKHSHAALEQSMTVSSASSSCCF